MERDIVIATILDDIVRSVLLSCDLHLENEKLNLNEVQKTECEVHVSQSVDKEEENKNYDDNEDSNDVDHDYDENASALADDGDDDNHPDNDVANDDNDADDNFANDVAKDADNVSVNDFAKNVAKDDDDNDADNDFANDVAKDADNDVVKDADNDVAEDASNDVAKDADNDVAKDAVNDFANDVAKDTDKDTDGKVDSDVKNSVKDNVDNNINDDKGNRFDYNSKIAQFFLDSTTNYPASNSPLDTKDFKSESTSNLPITSSILNSKKEISKITEIHVGNSQDDRISNPSTIRDCNSNVNSPNNELSSNNNNNSNSSISSSRKLVVNDSFRDTVSSTLQRTFSIKELKRSPRIYGRKVRQVEDLAIPSTSTGFVPSVIVLNNDYSNASSSSAYSTNEMHRRTIDDNFAFLSDSSDLSDDDERCEEIFGCENRAFESFEAIDVAHDQSEIIPLEECETLKNNDYIWSSMGLLKFAQVICCITMYVSIGLCRFHNRYIEIYCIFGACFSIFLLIVYSYRIQMDHWKSYTIRLLLSEYVYLFICTICDTVLAIIKFEFNEESNYGERMAVMILMISTGIAASTYCYDAILCYSLIGEASRNNPEEKKLLLSYLPTCSKTSRAEICDIFHTCIL